MCSVDLLTVSIRNRIAGWFQDIGCAAPCCFSTRSLHLRAVRPANAILTTEMHGLPLLQVVAVAMLILANAFFVAAEFALVSVRDTRIEQLLAAGVPGARAVRRLQHSLDDFLPAVQLGVTLCSLALGWIGEPLAAGVFLGWMQLLPQPLAHANAYAHISSRRRGGRSGIRLITYFHVTVGELVPKSLALRRADALAVAVAPAMLLFMRMARPAVRILRGSAAVILRGFDIQMTERGGCSLARGTQTHCHRGPAPWHAPPVSGNTDSPRD